MILLRLYSLGNSQIYCSVINYRHQAVHHIPMTHLYLEVLTHITVSNCTFSPLATMQSILCNDEMGFSNTFSLMRNIRTLSTLTNMTGPHFAEIPRN